jgi:hypothetical protein
VLAEKSVWGEKKAANTKYKFKEREREREPIERMKPKIHIIFDGRGKTCRGKELLDRGVGKGMFISLLTWL